MGNFCKARPLSKLCVAFSAVKDGAVIFALNGIVGNMLYDHCVLSAHDKPDDLCDELHSDLFLNI